MRPIYSLLPLLFLGLSCATSQRIGKGIAPEELYARACVPVQDVKSVEGSIWLKTKSPELSGQFSASVLATAPDQLKLEFVNILGGSEAIVTVQGNHYQVTSAGQKLDKPSLSNGPSNSAGSEPGKLPSHAPGSVTGEGYGSWGGIPLRWATEVFLGKIPCPAHPPDFHSSARVNSEGDLVILVPKTSASDAQSFTYRFKEVFGKPWPESVHWERMGSTPVVVDFRFDDPEEVSLSPRKWEVQSSQGAVKVKWQERDFVLKTPLLIAPVRATSVSTTPIQGSPPVSVSPVSVPATQPIIQH